MSKLLRSLACVFCLFAAPLWAADGEEITGIDIELNALAPQEPGCLLSFVVLNGHDSEISQAVFEAVLFDGAGQVHQLTLFDFGSLPPARPRVRQFIVPSLACDQVSRIIFNGASTCIGEGVAPTACSTGLTLRTRTDTEVLG